LKRETEVASSNEIRDAFLKYFERYGHKIVSSSSLIPFNDPTLLFTNAGMNQFKDVFLGNEVRPYRRATTSQKCMRVSGKHNDFKDVGHSMRHHTFFEMLGNFSFGDYFKKDAIHFGWELVTRDYGLDPKRVWITVYQDDDEAFDLWHKQEGVPKDKIFRLGEKENFWAMGETGPCGPCSELHYDFGISPLADHPDCDLTCGCGRWVEIWNLVFMQFNRDVSGKMTPLPSPSIDTGMGLERITTVMQGKTSNYDTDLFQPLLGTIGRIANADYGANPNDDVSMRIIADHARAAAFVIADGQYPGNDKRGYVLRKIMRRAMVHGKKLKITGPFIYQVAGTVVEIMKHAYPELIHTRDTVAKVIRQEEEAFADTLSQGLKDFYERAQKIKTAGSGTLPGDVAFFLYDTRGLPLEIIEDLAGENGLIVDEAGFNGALERQRERARKDYQLGKVREEVAQALFEGKTVFSGYDYSGPVDAQIKALLVDGERAEGIQAGQKGELVFDRTPFYAEAGGQIGDTGILTKGGGRARVINTLYRGTTISHQLEMLDGSFEVGETVQASVDIERRRMTMKNHTATHLLQAALQNVLGKHVKQAGSLVEPDRLRFDFTHFAPLTHAEIRKIEDQVNEQIWRNSAVDTKVMELEQAMKSGAVALFGEKYQEKVRVVEIPGFSKELCGGTHVPATGTIGSFKIVSEGGISAGVRRIEAVTGPAALERFRNDEDILNQIQSEFKIGRQELAQWIEKFQAQTRDLNRQIGELKLQNARAGLSDGTSMRVLADELKQKLGSGIVVLGMPQNGKAALVVMVSDDLRQKIPAGKIIKEIAPIVGGAGGGKPELAEAGGKDSSKLADAISRSYSIIESILGNSKDD
jgi:alanyl-tRNA synthetase